MEHLFLIIAFCFFFLRGSLHALLGHLLHFCCNNSSHDFQIIVMLQRLVTLQIQLSCTLFHIFLKNHQIPLFIHGTLYSHQFSVSRSSRSSSEQKDLPPCLILGRVCFFFFCDHHSLSSIHDGNSCDQIILVCDFCGQT